MKLIPSSLVILEQACGSSTEDPKFCKSPVVRIRLPVLNVQSFAKIHSRKDDMTRLLRPRCESLRLGVSLVQHQPNIIRQHNKFRPRRQLIECRGKSRVRSSHQFNPRVTPGSGDGGIDIEVTRNGLRGVVQCKAHVACVGPHVVRDLYGLIHHSRADFGIIVSRGGFTRGAADFARDKPIYFLDTDDLIAMQEGRDVLATAFQPSVKA
jgi:hypothetical protein